MSTASTTFNPITGLNQSAQGPILVFHPGTAVHTSTEFRTDSVNPVFEQIKSQMVDWVIKDSPIMMHMIATACDLEHARLNQSDDGRSLLYQIEKCRCDLFRQSPDGTNNASRSALEILCLRAALYLLSQSERIGLSNLQMAQSFRGIAMAMIFMAQNRNGIDASPENYNFWAMNFLYHDLDSQNHAGFLNKLNTLSRIAKDKLHSIVAEFTPHNILCSKNFNGLNFNSHDFDLSLRTICHFMTHQNLLEMLLLTRQPQIHNHADDSELAWKLNMAGREELFRRETQIHPGHQNHGGRNMAAVKCRIECAYGISL